MEKTKKLNIVNVDKIKGLYQISGYSEKQDLDYERYNIDTYTGLSTKEYSIIVDFKDREISGDCIAFGSWFDIEVSEACNFLLKILEEKQMERDFSDILSETLWKILSDVPFDESDSFEMILSEDFFHFPKGTERTDMWHWFDEMHSKGVAYLINEYEF